MKVKIFFLLLVFLFNKVQATTQHSKVHEKLTDAEFQKVFHRHRRDVPNYEFTSFDTAKNHRAKRELRPVEFSVNGKTVKLNLHPIRHSAVSNYIPVWSAKTKAGQSYYYEPVNEGKVMINGIFYEDPENMASLIAYYKDRHIYYDGIFNEGKDAKVVRSEPERWWKESNEEKNENHFIFKVNQTEGITETIDPNVNDSNDEKLEKPLTTFYPKLLVIVDYSLFEKLGKDIQETANYVGVFWNAVNLKFKEFKSPKVNVIVTGLIVAEDDTALKYIYDSRNKTDMSILNYNQMLNAGGYYFNTKYLKEEKFDNYDATITMTSLNTGITLGAAFQGYICHEYLNAGFIGDDGSFSGVLTAAHELGHMLGLPHDEKDKTCDGYVNDKTSSVMAPYASRVSEFVWSRCSKQFLHKFAQSKKAACLEHQYRRRH